MKWVVVVIGGLWGVVMVAPLVSLCDPTASEAEVWQSSGEAGLLGTDSLGRDVACRTLVGGWRLSLTALVSAVLATGLGSVVGLLLGWFAESRVSSGFAWLADMALIIPTVVIALIAAVTLPTSSAIMVATVAAGAPLTMRVMMDLTTGSRDSGYVRVARLRRESAWSIITSEVLPANLRAFGGDMAHRMVLALQLGAALHMLGFGPNPPAADWGTMMIENLAGLSLNPVAVVAPALALGVMGATVGLLAHLLTDQAGAR